MNSDAQSCDNRASPPGGGAANCETSHLILKPRNKQHNTTRPRRLSGVTVREAAAGYGYRVQVASFLSQTWCCLFSTGMVLIVSARLLAFLSLDVGFSSQLTYHQRTNQLRRKLEP